MGSMFISSTALASIPTTGAGWTYLLSQANADAGTPNLANKDSVVQGRVLAAAIAYKRNGTGLGLTYVQDKLKAVPGTETATTQPLNPYRQIAVWIVIADLVDFDGSTVCANGQTWDAWVASLPDKVLPGQTNWNTLRKCASVSGNNWGTYARASLLAIALRTANTTLRNDVLGWYSRWLGRTTHPVSGAALSNTFVASGSFSTGWDGPDTVYPTAQGAINPVSSDPTRDGANCEDASRGGAAPPLVGDGIGYTLEAMDGVLMTAVLIHRAGIVDQAGLPVWTWADSAIKRNALHANTQGTGGTSVYPTSNHIYWGLPWILNHVYGTTIPAQSEDYPGRMLSFGEALTATGSQWLKTSNTITAPTPALTLTLAGSPANTVTANASASVAGSAAITSYKFAWGDGTESTSASPSVNHTYSTGGTKTVTVTVTGADGASASTAKTISLTSNLAPVAAWTLAPVRGTAPLLVNYDATASSDPEGATITRTINWGDGSTTSNAATTGSHTYAAPSSYPATYTASLTVSDGTLSSTTLATITLDDPSESNTIEGGLAIDGRFKRFYTPPPTMTPSRYGLKAWSMDPLLAVTAQALTAQTEYVALCPIEPGTRALSTLHCYVTAAAAGLTYARMAVRSTAGVLLGQTGDLSTALTSTGWKSGGLTAPVNLPTNTRWVYVSVLTDGTTPPTLSRATAPSVAGVLTASLSGMVRAGTVAAQASLPSTASPVASNVTLLLAAS